MKICIFHPHLNNFGGGELVALNIAKALSKKHDVEILSSFKVNKQYLEKFFSFDLSGIDIKVSKLGSWIHKLPSLHSYKDSLEFRFLNYLNEYDLVIDTFTNGWFTYKLKCKTICYVHFPYFEQRKKGWKSITNPILIDAEHAFKYDKIVCNSKFTQKYLQKLINKQVDVIYPPVETSKIKKLKKENIVVTVGRFSEDKKHEIMIEAFKKLNIGSFQFHLIGSFQENNLLYSADYLKKLKRMAAGHKIFFHTNMEHNKVLEFLSKSKIYWHARGYDETNPSQYENFGITTVEAMAAGCVPVVINKGAQPEIVQHNKNGLVWATSAELIKYTIELIKNSEKMGKLSKEAIKSSKKYSKEKFEREVIELVNNVYLNSH